jgi:hypothetical protein
MCPCHASHSRLSEDGEPWIRLSALCGRVDDSVGTGAYPLTVLIRVCLVLSGAPRMGSSSRDPPWEVWLPLEFIRVANQSEIHRTTGRGFVSDVFINPRSQPLA